MRNRITYLDCNSDKRFPLALRMADSHFTSNCFVPGFADIAIFTTQILRTRTHVVKALSRNSVRKFNFETTICLPNEEPRNKPDIVWIDDITIPQILVRRLMNKYSTCSIILSCKPGGNKPKIIIDTREQKPMFNGAGCRKMKLVVGDYTTDALLHHFHVERKSPMDLYGTLTKGHVRFRNELILATANEIKLVIYVETTREKFTALKFPGGSLRKMPGETLLKIVRTMEKNYKTEVVWCKNRTDCQKQILLRFKKEESSLSK